MTEGSDEVGPIAWSDEDWLRHSRSQPPSSPPIFDVLMPVYGGLELTLNAIASVLRSTNETPYRLVVIDDAGPEPELSKRLGELARLGLVELHTNDVNRGFPATCNRGFALHPDRDVVILNSDTLVFNDWLDRLHAHARRHPDAGTITPLTNNGEICSYPEFCKVNTVDLEVSPAELDEIAARVNGTRVVEVPTGVGFCMYVRRELLTAVGGFDEEAFGQGYGEENDLCRRAIESGWRNLVAGDLFVWHHGGGSFGASKDARVARAVATVEALHPGYLSEVGQFVADDPGKQFRTALDVARIRRRTQGRGFLMVTHSLGGGTERHVQDLRRILEDSGTPTLMCRVDRDDPTSIAIVDPATAHVPNIPTLPMSGDPRQLAELLHDLGIAHVHVHHLAGFPEYASEYFRRACAGAAVTYDVTVHDYMPVCPRINLIDNTGFYCGEPDVHGCQRCIDRSGSRFGRPAVWQWRARNEQFLKDARTVFVPSHDVADRLARYFPTVSTVARQHPELPLPEQRQEPSTSLPLRRAGIRRIGILGAIGDHKGSRVLLETARIAAENQLPIEFLVIGYTNIDGELTDLGNVHMSGAYEEGELEGMVRASDIDALWFPAVWPETYSYTLSAALSVEQPSICFDFGAIAERLAESGRGIRLPIEAMLDAHRLATLLATVDLPDESVHARTTPPQTLDDPLRTYYGLDTEVSALEVG